MVIVRSLALQLFTLLIIGGCTTVQHVSKTDVTYQTVQSDSILVPDEEITGIIAPYKFQLDDKMNQVIAHLAHDLTREKPESTMGNWYTDAMMAVIAKHGFEADLAISNYGGLRVPQITAGPLTVGEIYELCPFDNMLLIVDMPGLVLDTLLQQIAATEGWPVSQSVWMEIKDKKLVDCMIHDQPLDHDAIYKVAMPDYVANGGDGFSMLIRLSRTQTGMLVRDALIEHATETAKAGMEITSLIQGRIVIKP